MNNHHTCFVHVKNIRLFRTFLNKRMNIFNMDETGVMIVHKGGKVVTEMGHKNVWSITSGEKGKTHTILACVSTSGFFLLS